MSTYFLVGTDGSVSVGEATGSPLSWLRELVGEPGWDRVRLSDDYGMAGFVNDVGFLLGLERNVVGSVLLGTLGGGQQPYAGPVVITGWDTYSGGIEITSLEPVDTATLSTITSDIRKVLGLDEGAPTNQYAGWMRAVRDFAELVRSAPTPRIEVVSVDLDGAS